MNELTVSYTDVASLAARLGRLADDIRAQVVRISALSSAAPALQPAAHTCTHSLMRILARAEWASQRLVPVPALYRSADSRLAVTPARSADPAPRTVTGDVPVPLGLTGMWQAAGTLGAVALASAVGATGQNLWEARLAARTGGMLGALGAMSDIGDDLPAWAARSLGMLTPETYERTLSTGLGVLGTFGILDRATVLPSSRVSAEEMAQRARTYIDGTHQLADGQVRDNIPPPHRSTFQRPATLSDLAWTMGTLDAMGSDDQAVIRVMYTRNEPPAFTVVFPSTQDWGLPGPVPNDLLGNLSALAGESSLVAAAKVALDSEMDALGADPDTSPVMVAGFSQGGLAAAAFAASYANDVQVTHVVSFGAPIARIDVPAHVDVIAYEFADDPVPGLDGATNPTAWHTQRLPGGAHNASEYARAAETAPPPDPQALATFLPADRAVAWRDYYAVRQP